MIEGEVGDYLRRLSIPEETKRTILDAYQRQRSEATERDRQRQALEGQLLWLADLYQFEDIQRGDYDARRTAFKVQLAQIADADAHGRPEVLDR